MYEELAKAIEALRTGAPDIWTGLATEHAQANAFLGIISLLLATTFLVIGLCIRQPLLKWVSNSQEKTTGTTDRDMAGGFVGLALLLAVGILLASGIDSIRNYLQPSVALLGLLR